MDQYSSVYPVMLDCHMGIPQSGIFIEVGEELTGSCP